MDQGLLPAQVVPNTMDALWRLVSKALYRTHVEGKLKARARHLMHIGYMVGHVYSAAPHARRGQAEGARVLSCPAVRAPQRRIASARVAYLAERCLRTSKRALKRWRCGRARAGCAGLAGPGADWGLAAQAEIIQDPAAYAELDPDMAMTLLDQKQAVRALFPPPPKYRPTCSSALPCPVCAMKRGGGREEGSTPSSLPDSAGRTRPPLQTALQAVWYRFEHLYWRVAWLMPGQEPRVRSSLACS